MFVSVFSFQFFFYIGTPCPPSWETGGGVPALLNADEEGGGILGGVGISEETDTRVAARPDSTTRVSNYSGQ